jgi:hypothetical protein
MLTKYQCGHIGKTTGRKVKRFIRVAEIRNQTVEESSKQCPACKGNEEQGAT